MDYLGDILHMSIKFWGDRFENFSPVETPIDITGGGRTELPISNKEQISLL